MPSDDTRDYRYRPKPSITNVNSKHLRCISLAKSRGTDLDKGTNMDLSSNDDNLTNDVIQ